MKFLNLHVLVSTTIASWNLLDFVLQPLDTTMMAASSLELHDVIHNVSQSVAVNRDQCMSMRLTDLAMEIVEEEPVPVDHSEHRLDLSCLPLALLAVAYLAWDMFGWIRMIVLISQYGFCKTVHWFHNLRCSFRGVDLFSRMKNAKCGFASCLYRYFNAPTNVARASSAKSLNLAACDEESDDVPIEAETTIDCATAVTAFPVTSLPEMFDLTDDCHVRCESHFASSGHTLRLETELCAFQCLSPLSSPLPGDKVVKETVLADDLRIGGGSVSENVNVADAYSLQADVAPSLVDIAQSDLNS
eukprot:TRINITY_DN59091_c0_g1_i1.p1 TRINITY_DN59091_c0_g1~~TRINITY_DN59091_c0_g1_i1.p1  ORF type:complete len:302 (+),score=40.82 TRINITY_DN59091_c0_g1_i1:48-953(+)